MWGWTGWAKAVAGSLARHHADARDHITLTPVWLQVNLLAPDFARHPLQRRARRRVCVLEAGEVLYVPAGSPHHVDNMTPSLAISANYVDETNVDAACVRSPGRTRHFLENICEASVIQR